MDIDANKDMNMKTDYMGTDIDMDTDMNSNKNSNSVSPFANPMENIGSVYLLLCL
jgi:hypothetical protein